MSDELANAARDWVYGMMLSVALDEGTMAPVLRPKVEAWLEESTGRIFSAVGLDETKESQRRLGLEAAAAFKARYTPPEEPGGDAPSPPSPRREL